MTNENRKRVGGMGVPVTGQDDESLKLDRLVHRMPWLAEFARKTQEGDTTLTEAQRAFLDKFSAGLAEALSDKPDETSAKSRES